MSESIIISNGKGNYLLLRFEVNGYEEVLSCYGD